MFGKHAGVKGVVSKDADMKGTEENLFKRPFPPAQAEAESGALRGTQTSCRHDLTGLRA